MTKVPRRARSSAYLLVAPAAALLLALLLIPLLSVVAIAFTNWQFGSNTLNFVGLNNFKELSRDPVFWAALRNTLVYVSCVVPASVALGLAVALLIESHRSFRAFYRTVHFLPVIATLSAMAVVWESMLHPMVGLVNQALEAFGLRGANWLRDERTVLFTIIVIGIWQTFGLAMVLFLAGLKTIPRELYEAAELDGVANWVDTFATVTAPLLGPITLVVLLYVAIRGFQVFDVVAMLTQGGPNKGSEVLLYMIYTESFSYLRAGYGAALSVLYLSILATVSFLQIKFQRRWTHYQ